MTRHGFAALAAAITLIAAPAAPAAVVFLDDFTSPAGNLVGTTPDTGLAWTQTGATATNPIQANGSAAALVTSGQDVYAGFSATLPSIAGESVHTSLDVNVSAAQATGDYFAHLSDPLATTSNFYQRLSARSSGNGYQLGLLDTSGTNSATTWGTTVLSFNQSYHVDVFWDFVAGATNDTFEVLVDLNPYLTHTWTSILAEPGQLVAANLRQGTAANAPTLTVDNLTVEGTIPEPASASLVAVSALALSALRRRR
jgi:hypothetical protein